MKTWRDNIHYDLFGGGGDSSSTSSTTTNTTTTVQEYVDSFNTTISNVYNLSNVGNTAIAVGDGGGSLSLGSAFSALSPQTSPEDVKQYAIWAGLVVAVVLILSWIFRR